MDTAAALSREAHFKFSAGQSEEAIRLYTDAIKLDPTNDSYFSSRGSCYRHLCKYKEAIQDYSTAIGISQNVVNFITRGCCFGHIKKELEAIKDFSSAIAIEPYRRNIYYCRGRLYHKFSKFKDAISDYSREIEIGPTAECFGRRADAYVAIKKPIKALKDYYEASIRDPYNNLYFNEKARICYQLRTNEKILRQGLEWLTRNPHKRHRNMFIKFLEAIVVYQKEIKLNPNKDKYNQEWKFLVSTIEPL